ncbi:MULTISPECIES: ABC transporter ATP-binding protein [unclassified Pseudoalteromonas]|uniref:ABC transporter ATP-binding protein n=1 Tax=unclassified Pseudoalteromonas TaxID=194690 RepID=UPI0005A78E75|nr:MULTISPECIES: ABC transporter ATP-binding protein [unclassified Pseudoalteromonas]
MLDIKNLNHSVNDGTNEREILSDINLKLAQGQSLALMGDSGSGKTSLLNLICALEPIQQGDIYLSNTNIKNLSDKKLSLIRKNELGIIFQQFNLLTGLNVKDNIAFSAKLANKFDQQHITKLTESLSIDHLLEKYPATLSGGEIQRVAIARALAAKPKLLLADEPTGNLDIKNSNIVVDLLVNLAKTYNTALLVVTHSQQVAQKMDVMYCLVSGKLSQVHALEAKKA